MIGKTISHYRITAELGEGGMGVVYEALDTKLDRQVALKFLPPELTGDVDAKQRFIREAKSASALKHNHVCTIHDIDEAEGRLFISMDLYEGGSLRDRLDEGALEVTEALDLAVQIADGLSAAHEAEIVHRDIKPANILLTKKGDVKIADFGLAKLSGQTKLTKTGTTVGTAGYMSPEQVQGQEVGSQSDVWSVGVMLYQMGTGKLPFTGEHDAALAYSIVNTDPVPLSIHRSDVPAGMQEIIDRCLAKNPAERYRNGEELKEALTELRNAIGSGAVSGVRTPSGSTGVKKRNMIGRTIAAAAVVLIIAAALIYKFYPRPVAAEQSIAVVDFQDLSGGEDPTLAPGITSLVNVGLIDNCSVRVVSTSYLHDLRRRLFEDAEGSISRDQALEIARESGASMALIGEVSVVGEEQLVIWQLVDTKNGRAVGGKTARGGDIFVCADMVVTEVLPFLNRISAVKTAAVAKPVSDLSTKSPEAYKYFTAGVQFYEHNQGSDARRELMQAVEIDSTFALAYIFLSKAHYGATVGTDGDIDAARKYAEAAWRHRNRLSAKEILRLEARRYWVNGSNSEAWVTYDKILERWPDELETLEEYARQLYYRGSIEKAAEVAIHGSKLFPKSRTLLEIAYAATAGMQEGETALDYARKLTVRFPEYSNNWDNLGLAFLALGQPDSAENAFNKALTVDPSYIYPVQNLAALAYARGDIRRAMEQMQDLPARTDIDEAARIAILCGYGYVGLSSLYAERGQCRAALRIVDDAWMHVGSNSSAKKRVGYAQCRVLFRMERYQEALIAVDSLQKSIGPGRRAAELEWFRARAHIALGDLLSARAAQRKRETTQVVSKDDMQITGIEAELAFAEARFDEAIDLFLKYKQAGGWGTFWSEIEGRANLARAYHAAGRSNEAIAELTEMLRIYKGHALGHYELGKIYEDLGRTSDAVDSYERFLEMWAEADKDMPQLIDARKRLERIRRNV